MALARVLVLLLVSGAVLSAASQDPASEPIRKTLEEVAVNDPGAYAVDAAGMSRSGRRMWSLEPTVPLDQARRRGVILGGLDGASDGAAAAVGVRTWYLTL